MSRWFKLFQKKNFVQQSYLILFIILFALIVVLYNCLTPPFISSSICSLWLKDFSLNLTTELVGILLVVFSVDRAVTFRQQQENHKFKQIAFRQLRFTLIKQLHLLVEMFKDATDKQPKKYYNTLADFLQDDTYFRELAALNLLKNAPVLTPQGEKMDWLDYLHAESLNLKSAISLVVDRYSFYLDSEVVELMENLSDAVFIRFMTSIWEAKKLEAYTEHGDLLSDCEELFREYISQLLTLVDFYNDSVPIERQINLDWPTWIHGWQYHSRSKFDESQIEDTDD